MTPLELAIDGWRRSRHPRFARLAELATARALPVPRELIGADGKPWSEGAWKALFDENDPLDVPRLLAAIAGRSPEEAMERPTLLLSRDDPRVFSGVHALIDAPPYKAPAFLDLCIRVAAGEPKSATELSAELEALAVRLEAALEVPVTKPERPKAPQQTLDERQLLEAVYAAPDDDAPRLVLADALMERGELRGEFIALQIQRSRGAQTKAGFVRERELFRDEKLLDSFAHPLNEGGRAVFSRGFVDRLVLKKNVASRIIGAAELRTVTTISELGALSPMSVRKLLQHSNATNLRRVFGVLREHFDALEGELPWREVGLLFPTVGDDLARLPNLDSLHLTVMGEAYPVEGELGRVRHFDFNGRLAANVLPRLTSVEHLELSLPFGSDGTVWQQLRELRALKTLRLRGEPSIGGFNLPQLASLTFDLQPDIALERVLDAAPNLKALHVSTPHHIKRLEDLLSERLRQLEVAHFGIMKFERPFAEDGVLTFTMPFPEALESFVHTLARLPAGIARRAVLRHPNADDPSAFWFELPKEEHLDMVRGANPALPVEVEWY